MLGTYTVIEMIKMTDLRSPKKKGKPCPQCGADAEKIKQRKDLPQLGGRWQNVCEECNSSLASIVEASGRGLPKSYWSKFADEPIEEGDA